MSEPADLEAGLRAFLLADVALSALVGTRVFGGELPADQTAAMPRQCIVIKGSGGVSLTGNTSNEHDTERVDLRSFGATPREASIVARTAALAMKRMTRSVHGEVLLHWANVASGAIPGREPGTEWPFRNQSFQVLHHLTTVSPE